MEKTITANQTSLMLVIFTVALKLSVLPAITCDYAGNSAYIVSLIALTFDFVLTVAILIILNKIPEKNFFTLIKETLSKPVAIIVYIFLFVYFFLKLLITILELHDYYIVTLFDEFNPLYFIITLVFFFIFMFNQSFRTIGRLIEVCFWPMLIGIIFTLVFPAGDIELPNLLPIFDGGIYPIYHALMRTSFAYGDYMILFILMGNIVFKKNSKKKILLYFINILSFIFNFYVIFVGSFGNTAVNQSLALSELPLHNPYPASIGRLEWLTIIMWSAILLIHATLLGLSCSTCIRQIFNVNDKKIPAFVIVGLIAVAYIPTFLQLESILKFATSKPFVWVFGLFQVLCIVILYLCYFIHKRKNKDFKTRQKKGKINDFNSKKNYTQ